MTHEMETAVKYQSHLPALLACIASSSGPVLELGVGFFSTPHLHAICLAMKRNLVSVEQNKEWHAEFRKYDHIETRHSERFSHAVMLGEYMEVLTCSGIAYIDPWSVAFIDSPPGGQARADLFKHLLSLSDYVVVRDAQKDAENFQAIEPMLEGLLEGVHWHLCTGYYPHTLVCSKTRIVPAVLLRM